MIDFCIVMLSVAVAAVAFPASCYAEGDKDYRCWFWLEMTLAGLLFGAVCLRMYWM